MSITALDNELKNTLPVLPQETLAICVGVLG